MNTVNDHLAPTQPALPSSIGNKPLWAAVSVLSVAVLAMGGSMLYRQGAQSASAAVPVAVLASSVQPSATAKPAVLEDSRSAADDLIEKPAAQPKKVVSRPVPRPAPAQRYAAVSPAPRQAAYPSLSTSPSPSNYPVSYPQASVCATCGSVESVTPVERAVRPGSPISIGSVAGGVLGAALGNQVGHGNGRTLATVLGAVGGGYAGHVIEGQVRKVTTYQVGVRMEDGSRRTIEASSPPVIGSRVTVDGNTLQSQGGAYQTRPAPIPVSYSQSTY